MTTKTSRNLTDDYLSFAEDEFKAGNITRAMYDKSLLQIAAEYLSEHSDEEACLRALNKVDSDYIKDQLSDEMHEDSFLASTMAELAHHLERRGITWEAIIRPTQTEGNA